MIVPFRCWRRAASVFLLYGFEQQPVERDAALVADYSHDDRGGRLVNAVKFERALRLSAGQRSSGSSALLHGCGFIGSSILLALLACKILAESNDAGDYHYQHGKDNEQQEYHKYSEEGDLKSENKLFAQGHTHVKIIKH